MNFIFRQITKFSLALFITICFVKTSKANIQQKNNDAIIGMWQTVLEENGSEVTFILEFNSTETDSLIATIHLPEFGLSNMPYGKFIVNQDSLILPGLVAKFDGDKQLISGNLSLVGTMLDVVFRKVTKKPSIHIDCPEKSPEWTFSTNSPIWTSPTIYNKSIIFGNDEGVLHSVKIHDKSIDWTFKSNGAIRSKAVIIEHAICFTSDDGFLYLLDAKSGTLKWKVDIGNNASTRINPAKDGSSYDYLCSSPTESKGKIFIGSMDSCIYALSAMDGSVIWKFKTGDMVRSKPAVDEEYLYVGSWDHFMYALNIEDGSLIWKYDAGWSIQSSPLVLEDKVIFGSRAASVFALNKKTGQEVWKTRYWGSWVESSPVVFDNTIYIGSSDFRKVYALDPSDGKALMHANVEGWAWPTVAVTEDYIYTGSIGNLGYAENMYGKFYAFERKTGKPVWQFKVDETDKVFAYGFASSPTLWKNWVFVGGLDGNMYGLKVK